MKGEDRCAALAAYRERKIPAGIYAVRCAASGEAWVGQTPNLEAIENRERFTLRFGEHRSASLQAAWRAHGDAGLAFETLETLKPDLTDYARRAQLKERLEVWANRLGAQRL